MSRSAPLSVRRELCGPAAGWEDWNANEEREVVVEIADHVDFVLHVVVRHADHPSLSRADCEALATKRAHEISAFALGCLRTFGKRLRPTG